MQTERERERERERLRGEGPFRKQDSGSFVVKLATLLEVACRTWKRGERKTREGEINRDVSRRII